MSGGPVIQSIKRTPTTTALPMRLPQDTCSVLGVYKAGGPSVWVLLSMFMLGCINNGPQIVVCGLWSTDCLRCKIAGEVWPLLRLKQWLNLFFDFAAQVVRGLWSTDRGLRFVVGATQYQHLSSALSPWDQFSLYNQAYRLLLKTLIN